MSLLVNKFTMSEDFLNRVCENLKQDALQRVMV